MKSKPQPLEKQESYKWAKYRWECMRRNPKIMGELLEALKRADFNLGEYLLSPPKGLNSLFGPVVDEILKDDLWSADSSFDEIIEKLSHKGPGAIGKILASNLVSENQAIKYDLEKSKLIIEIDLDEVYSVESLKRLVCDIVRSSYIIAEKLKYITPKKRPNMTDFDVILKVGDMKKGRKKNREIAKAIHPRKYAENPESAIRLIGHYHKRYKELVDGMGFLKLTYP